MKQQILMIHNSEKLYKKLKQALEDSTITTKLCCDFGMMLFVLLPKRNFAWLLWMHRLRGRRFAGFEVMQTVKPVPMLYLSSNTDYTDRLGAFEAGASAYLGKPYSLEECVAQIKALLRLYEDLKFQRIKLGT